MKKHSKKGVKKTKRSSPGKRGGKKVKLHDIMEMRLKEGRNTVKEKFLLGSEI